MHILHLTPIVTPAGKRGDKNELKRELESSSSQITLSATANQPPSKKGGEPSPLTEPTRSGSTSQKAKDKVEKVQWSVRSTGTSNGSPITILTKTVTTNAESSTPSVSSGVASTSSSVHITPRMAQLLSSVASSQALVKSSKAVSSSSKAPTHPVSTSSPKTDKQQFTLHSEVQALLSKFQSSQATTSVGSTQPSPVLVSSSTHSPVQVSTPSPPGSAASRGVSPGSGGSKGSGKLISPKSKITTSPIQMKAIVSQLKPKTSSQAKLIASKPTLVQPNVSSSVPSLVKVKKMPAGISSGSSSKASQASSLHTVGGRPPTQSNAAMPTNFLQASFSSSTSPASNKQSQGAKLTQSQGVKQTVSTKVSPPKSKAMNYASQLPPVSVKRPDQSTNVIRVHSTSPLSNSHSSASSPLSSTSPQSHSPLSAVVQQMSPPLPPSPSPPPSLPPPTITSRPASIVATSAMSGSSLYPSSALEGTPILLKKQQQQPTTVRQPIPQKPANTSLPRQAAQQQPVNTALLRQEQPVNTALLRQEQPVNTALLRQEQPVNTPMGQPLLQQQANPAIVKHQQHSATLPAVRQTVQPQPVKQQVQQVQPVLVTSSQPVVLQQQLDAMSAVRQSVQLHQPPTATIVHQTPTTIPTVKHQIQPQPATVPTATAATTNRQQIEQQHANISLPSTDFLAQIAATTLPFSSCASSFVLTSPLPQFTHHSSTSPLTHHQTPPVRPPNISLPLHPLTPTVPLTNAQVLVGGISGTGIKSPVEQIYLEHSYGGQNVSEGIDGGPEVCGSNVPLTDASRLQ